MYKAISEGKNAQEARGKRFEILQKLTWVCPQCHQNWLIFSSQNKEQHVCKSCGYIKQHHHDQEPEH